MNDNNRERKKIAPIVICVCIMVCCGLFMLAQIGVMIFVPGMAGPGLINLVVCGVIIGATAVVLYLRLKEIDGGEEDEASKY